MLSQKAQPGFRVDSGNGIPSEMPAIRLEPEDLCFSAPALLDERVGDLGEIQNRIWRRGLFLVQIRSKSDLRRDD